MADLIIKSSPSNNLVIQGGDNSPAITVGNTGTTTFAENATLSGTANNLGTITAGTIGSSVAFPSKHILQTVGNTDATNRTIASPQGEGCLGCSCDIISSVANSNFCITGTIPIYVVGSHGACGLFLNGLSTASNLIYTPSFADASGSTNGWYGLRTNFYSSADHQMRVFTNLSFFYDPGTTSVNTTFSFKIAGMGYYQNGQIEVNEGNSGGRNSMGSTLTIMEVAP